MSEFTYTEGRSHIGHGVYLDVEGGHRSFTLRYTALDGRRRHMGLGRCDATTLEQFNEACKRAIDRAIDAKEQLFRQIDPIDQRRDAKREARAARSKYRALTLRNAMRLFNERNDHRWSARYARQWIVRVERDCPQWLLDAPAFGVTSMQVMGALMAVESIKRRNDLRNRIDVVMEWLVCTSGLDKNPGGVRRGMNEVQRDQLEATGPAA